MPQLLENRSFLGGLGGALAILTLLLGAGFRGAGQPLAAAEELGGPAVALSREAATTAASKFRLIGEGFQSGQSFEAVRVTELEANSYLEYELASSLPAGVSKLRLGFEPNRPIGSAVINFDILKGGLRTPPNPIADFLLRGLHTVGVEGTLAGSEGIGEFQLERVTLDGFTLPRPVVEYLIEHYLRPRYPAAAISRPFLLPFSLDQVSVEAGSVLLKGKPANN